MSEEFGTVNLKRAESREIELLRRHYQSHRDSLGRLIADAPSEVLAREYQRLIGEIDTAVLKLDEREGRKPGVNADTNPAMRATGPGTRPLVRPTEPAGVPPTDFFPAASSNARLRIAIIITAGVVVLAIIGWLIWKASSEGKPVTPIVERPITTTIAAPPPAFTPAPTPVATLTITPAAADYGVIRRGTRAVRQFEIANTAAAPVEIEVARSACHCLFYDYNVKLPAKGKESITVTIASARSKLGPLQEMVVVQAKKDPTIKATFEVRATIR
jgi:hypothetical protein